jgi:signal peptidase II
MLPYLLSAVLVWSFDRLSKKLVLDRLGGAGSHISLAFFTLRLKYNLISNRSCNFLSFVSLWILAAAAALTLIIVIGGQYSTPLVQIALGAAVGGGAGNLYDLWRFGAVQDFIHFKFTAFNIADIAISVGITLTLVSALFA